MHASISVRDLGQGCKLQFCSATRLKKTSNLKVNCEQKNQLTAGFISGRTLLLLLRTRGRWGPEGLPPDSLLQTWTSSQVSTGSKEVPGVAFQIPCNRYLACPRLLLVLELS